MITDEAIERALPQALETVDVPSLGGKIQGKVRDIYLQDDKRILIATDRQSAFDVILGHIPYKGAVLTGLSKFWFEKTSDIIANHMISVPDPNVMVVYDCNPITVEVVVRGYMTGVTTTSIWYSYERGEREIYGIPFPEGLKKNDKLPSPVITPTTHGGGSDGHDERLTREQIIGRGLVEEKLYEQIEKAALSLFERGTEICSQKGLMLVDTKYEFGILNGRLVIMDEMHTPDSSRFWIANTYDTLHRQGKEPENFDKEFLRLWYVQHGYRGDGSPPPMQKELAITTARRYIDVYEKITGETFQEFSYPIEQRILQSLAAL